MRSCIADGNGGYAAAAAMTTTTATLTTETTFASPFFTFLSHTQSPLSLEVLHTLMTTTTIRSVSQECFLMSYNLVSYTIIPIFEQHQTCHGQ